jgi:hypothetical protein
VKAGPQRPRLLVKAVVGQVGIHNVQRYEQSRQHQQASLQSHFCPGMKKEVFNASSQSSSTDANKPKKQ